MTSALLRWWLVWGLVVLMVWPFTLSPVSALERMGPAEVYVRLSANAAADGCPGLEASLQAHDLPQAVCTVARNTTALLKLRWLRVDHTRLSAALQATSDLLWFEFRAQDLQTQTRLEPWPSNPLPSYHDTLWPAQRSAEDPAFIQPNMLRLRALLNTYRPTAPVVVAVIDSGVNFQKAPLAGLQWRSPGEIPDNGLDDDGNGYVDDVQGWDFVDEAYDDWFDDSRVPDNDPSDRLGHGTAVATILAHAIGPEAVSRTLRLMPLRVASGSGGSGNVSPFALAEAIRYATAQGAQVINISIGSFQEYEVIRDAINDALAQQVIVVAAAGNSGDAVLFPANLPGVLAVGATDSQGQVWSASAKGPLVDVFFPGTQMLEGFSGSFPLLLGNGTSLSAPLATAVAAAFTALRGQVGGCQQTQQSLAKARVTSQDGEDWIKYLIDNFESEVHQAEDLALAWRDRAPRCGANISIYALLRRPG